MEGSKQWKDSIQRDRQLKGVLMVIGETDTGKSTLIRQLLAQALTPKRVIAVVDADMGQSSFGPPTCMSLTLWKNSGKAKEFLGSMVPPSSPFFRALYFIGSTSPRGYLPQVLVGIKQLVEQALEGGAELVLIDTTGMVQGRAGFLLKQMKIELVRPRYLLVLEKNRELSPLLDYLRHLPNMEISSIPISSKIHKRLRPERQEYRYQQFKRYFQNSFAQWVHLSEKKYLYPYPPLVQGAVVGLRSGKGETLGIGVIRRLARKRIEVITPVKPIKEVTVFEPSKVLLEGTYWRAGLKKNLP